MCARLGTLALLTFELAAQSYTYDAVSVHKSDPLSQNVRICEGRHGGIRTKNTSPLRLISAAWRLEEYRVVGAPAWALKDRYDVSFSPGEPEPQPTADAPPQTFDSFFQHNMLRLQAVLRDRFGLSAHTESRELPIYSLKQAKNGNKLTPHPPDQNGDRKIRGVNAAMEMLSMQLGMLFGRPVRDDTHLDGRYDIRLDWVPDDLPNAAPAGSARKLDPGPTGPSIFTALQEQLGLRLDSIKGPVDVLVIDGIHPPADN